MTAFRSLTRFALTACLGLLVLLTACDSGDPIDSPEPSDVAGMYSFTRFEFTPSASGVLQPINVLDTLNTAETNLRLSSGGNFILAYEFKEGDLFFLDGNFEVTAQSVRLRGDRDDRDRYQSLLLDNEITLSRNMDNPAILEGTIDKTINPADFSSRYEGIGSVSGTLHLRLTR